MAELIHFSPQSQLTAAENLGEFIRMCKDDLTLLGRDLNWHSWGWPGVQFTKLGTLARGCTANDALDSALMDFAKAYFRYQQSHHPTGTMNETKALRTLERALLQRTGSAAISGLDMATLDEAALIGRNNYSPMAAYHCGRELERLAAFVTTKHLIHSDLKAWKHPIKKPTDTNIQTGPKAKAIRDKKLPLTEALDALAEIFSNNPQNLKDTFTTSTFAFTMSAPSRIEEILHLPVDCEIEECDSKGIMRYGWRFFSGKGYEGNIKWIPTVMVPVAKEAVRRIRAMTEEGRKLARWMEETPSQPYRHAQCPDVPDDQPLTVFQACEFLGLAHQTRRNCTSSLGILKLHTVDGTNTTLSSLWEQIKQRQPEGFPWLSKEKGIKYSNAMFCMTRNVLHSQRGVSPVILWVPDGTVFNSDLSPRESLNSDSHKSIFKRYGYKSLDGQPLKLTSHQARHLLHTISMRGGLSEDAAARWAGRADVKQNSVYNHVSEFEMVAKAEALDMSLTLFGPAGNASQYGPISTQEFNFLERGAIHVTEFGVCVHDFTMSPCEKFRDCLNCREQVCLKGDGERLKRIKVRLEEVEKDYAAAKDAIEQGYSGADRWFEGHEKTVVRLRELVQILESPDVPDGSQIKLHDSNNFSHLNRVIQQKSNQARVGRTGDAAMLSEMARQLGSNLG